MDVQSAVMFFNGNSCGAMPLCDINWKRSHSRIDRNEVKI